MSKKILQLCISIVGVFLIATGCSSKNLESLEETQVSSQEESDYVIHIFDDYIHIPYELAERLVEEIQNNDFGDKTVTRFTASDNEIHFLSDNEIHFFSDITIYEDEDFMLVTIMDPDPGMMQFSGTELCTSDGGKTWYVRSFNRVISASTYIVDKKIIKIDGDGLWDLAEVSISYDSGATYETLDTENIFNIVIMLRECGLLEVEYLNQYQSEDEIHFVWRTSERGAVFYCMTVSLSNGKIENEGDFYDLADLAKAYKETGYRFGNSSSEYIDETELRKIYANMYLVGQNAKKVCSYIRYAINEIYARKGYDFTGTEYEDYFKDKEWYHPIEGKEISEEEINSYEKANIDLLVKIENEYKMLID